MKTSPRSGPPAYDRRRPHERGPVILLLLMFVSLIAFVALGGWLLMPFR